MASARALCRPGPDCEEAPAFSQPGMSALTSRSSGIITSVKRSFDEVALGLDFRLLPRVGLQTEGLGHRLDDPVDRDPFPVVPL